MEINANLDRIEKIANTEFLNFQSKHERYPDTKEIKNQIELSLFGNNETSSLPNDFFGYWDYYITNQQRSTSSKTGKNISSSTIQTYINAKNKLKAFEKFRAYVITFESIDLEFYYSFIEFLEAQDLSKNTIGKQIKILKGVLNDATSNEINTNLKYKSNKFNVLKEETTEIYLNPEELKLIIDLDLTNDYRLSVTRDLFIILCFTGQRYQSLRDILDPDNRDEKFIRLKQAKTSKRVVIPILPQIKALLSKLKPKDVISNPQMNKYIKEIGAMIPELHVKIKNEITRGGVKDQSTIKKYELIGTHTGRRSFSTNFYTQGKIPIVQIMSITGHTKESTFFAYIRTTPDEHAQRFLDLINE